MAVRRLRKGLPPLFLAAAAWPAARMLRAWLFSSLGNVYRLDYTLYYAAALNGLRNGWHHLYNLDLQRAVVTGISPEVWWFPLVFTPAMAVSMVPFTWLPLDQGYRIWSSILCASWVGCAIALAPGNPLAKAAHLALSFIPYPVALGLGLGQVIALQAGFLAAAYLLLRHDHEMLAGLCLLAIALKPQCMLLVPFTLLAAGRTRAFASFAIASALVAAALLWLIGLDGARAYLELIRYAQSHLGEFWVGWSYNLPQRFTSDGGRMLAQVAVALAALVAARRHRSVEMAIAAGLLGSLLVTAFIHLDDLMLLFPAAWLTLRRASRTAIPLLGCYLLLLLCTHTGTPVWGRWVLLFECVWLAALAALPLRWLTDERSAVQPGEVPIVPARL
jgi:hypothetical protein